MSEILNSIVFFIIAIGVLITFHEYGHFWVARKMGVTILRFSVGFGPPILRYLKKGSLTEYVVAAIPLGGYVRMLDENVDEVSDELKPTAFNRQPLYKRSAIVAAGPLANFLLAALLYAVVFLIGSDGVRPVIGQVSDNSIAKRSGFMVGDELRHVDGREYKSWDQHHFYLINRIMGKNSVEFEVSNGDQHRRVLVDFSELGPVDLQTQSLERVLGIHPQMPLIEPVVGDVVSGFPAQLAGLKPDDRIVSINGNEVRDWNSLVETVRLTSASQLILQVDRAGQIIELSITPRIVIVDGNEIKQIGITVRPDRQIRNSEYSVRIHYGPAEAVVKGFETMWSTTVLTVKMLVGLFSFDKPADAIGGPIAIAEYAGKAAQAGLNNYLTFLALLSISIGILNLLPIPVLDGGHLVFHAYEAVTGSPPTEKILGWANQVGFVLLICLMGFAFYNDLSRIL